MFAAQEVLAKPLMWSKPKEVPWAGQIRLENLAEQPALFLTATLTSEPISRSYGPVSPLLQANRQSNSALTRSP